MKKWFIKICSIPLRILTVPLQIIDDLFWFADEYRGFLHWLSNSSYELEIKLNTIISRMCGNY